MSPKKLLAISMCAVGLLVITAPRASAVPILQLYVEGATYDPVSESWVSTGSGTDPLRLWAIGNVDGEGGKGQINVYEITAAGFTGTIHVDLYDHYLYDPYFSQYGASRYISAPFSRDAEGNPPIPKPGTLMLLLSGVAALVARRRRLLRRT